MGDNVPLLNSRYLRAFMEEDQKGKLCLTSKDPTEKSIRIKIFDVATSFLRKHVGDSPTEEEKSAILNAIKYLFPSYRNFKESMLRNYLNDKLKNIRRRLREIEEDSESVPRKCNAEESKLLFQLKKKQKYDTERNITWLKHANVKTDEDQIIQLLKNTLKDRLKEYEEEDFSVFKSYAIFRCDPRLVSINIILCKSNLFFNLLFSDFNRF